MKFNQKWESIVRICEKDQRLIDETPPIDEFNLFENLRKEIKIVRFKEEVEEVA